MIFHENCLLADDSHEISCLICFLKKQQNLKLSSAASCRWRFMINCCLLIASAKSRGCHGPPFVSNGPLLKVQHHANGQILDSV